MLLKNAKRIEKAGNVIEQVFTLTEAGHTEEDSNRSDEKEFRNMIEGLLFTNEYESNKEELKKVSPTLVKKDGTESNVKERLIKK